MEWRRIVRNVGGEFCVNAYLQLEGNLWRDAVLEVGDVVFGRRSITCLEVKIFYHLLQNLAAARCKEDGSARRGVCEQRIVAFIAYRICSLAVLLSASANPPPSAMDSIVFSVGLANVVL